MDTANSTLGNMAGRKKYDKIIKNNRLIRRVVYVQLSRKSLMASLGFAHERMNQVCIFQVHCHCRIEYLCKKNVFFAIENPTGSLLWEYRPMKAC